VRQFGAGAEDVYEEPADPRARLDPFWELQGPHLRGQLIDCGEDDSGGARRDAARDRPLGVRASLL
jgi:hypothetical protein